jgi:hypothetical protein
MPSTIMSQHRMDTRCNHHPHVNLNIQLIECTITYDKYYDQTIKSKQDNYNPPIDAICTQGRKTKSLVVIISRVSGAIHKSNIDALESLHIPKTSIKAINESYPPYRHTTPHILSSKQTEVKQKTNTRPYPLGITQTIEL